MAAKSRTVSVQLGNGTLRALDDTCQHYRWKRSQAIAEYVAFYHRLQDAMQEYDIMVSEDGTRTPLVRVEGEEWRAAEDRNAETCLIWLIQDLKKGLLAGFRPPVNPDDDDEEES